MPLIHLYNKTINNTYKSVVFLCSILTNSKKIVLYKYKVKTLY